MLNYIRKIIQLFDNLFDDELTYEDFFIKTWVLVFITMFLVTFAAILIISLLFN